MHNSANNKLYISFVLIIAFLSICACCKGQNANEGAPAIKSFVIGDSVGTIEPAESGNSKEYVIIIDLPEDIDFKNCLTNIELESGAEISEDSPCLVDYVGGRPILNFTRQSRTLVVKYKGRTQNFEFNIGIKNN